MKSEKERKKELAKTEMVSEGEPRVHEGQD